LSILQRKDAEVKRFECFRNLSEKLKNFFYFI